MLTAAQVAEFHEKGFVLGGRVLDDAQLDVLRSDLERIIADRSTEGPQPLLKTNLGEPASPIWQIVNIWFASDAFRSLLSHPVIVEELVQLSGARGLKVWHDQIQYKPAENGGVNMWHQDSPVWLPLSPKDAQLSAWVALDDADVDNGCMSMVPGSHAWGDHLEFLRSNDRFDGLPEHYEGRRVAPERRPVKAGHVHYHHSLTWHGSDLNTSGRPRRAVALHYMTERTRYVAEPDPLTAAFAGLLGVTSAPGELIEGPYFASVYDGKVQTVDEVVPQRSGVDWR